MQCCKDSAKPCSTTVRLQTYAYESLEVVGSTTVQVGMKAWTAELSLIVVKGDGATLLGRNWLHKIKLNWRKIQQVRKSRLHSLLEQYSEVFQV